MLKTLVVLSGKGGAGKTCVTAALASLAAPAVLVDADVDAANLGLLLDATPLRSEPFVGAQCARLDPTLCDGCLECVAVCRARAIAPPEVDTIACEGCGACLVACPRSAIQLEPVVTGRWRLSETPWGPLVHARLGPGGESSGALVARVRTEAGELARLRGLELTLVDGPPGTGCPAISAVTGSDLALLVTEPTPSGLSDLERVLGLVHHFDVPAAVVVNKYDLEPSATHELIAKLESRGLPVVAKLPWDEEVSRSIREGRLLSARPGPWQERLQALWTKLARLLELPADGALPRTFTPQRHLPISQGGETTCQTSSK